MINLSFAHRPSAFGRLGSSYTYRIPPTENLYSFGFRILSVICDVSLRKLMCPTLAGDNITVSFVYVLYNCIGDMGFMFQ